MAAATFSRLLPPCWHAASTPCLHSFGLPVQTRPSAQHGTLDVPPDMRSSCHSSCPPTAGPRPCHPPVQYFSAIDSNRSGTLDVYELQKALALGGLQFSLKTVQVGPARLRVTGLACLLAGWLAGPNYCSRAADTLSGGLAPPRSKFDAVSRPRAALLQHSLLVGAYRLGPA